MPMLIDYIDHIALKKQRDVLFVRFIRPNSELYDDYNYYESSETRKSFIAFLRANNIGFAKCGPTSSSAYLGGYFGDLYIDVPFDENSAEYRKVEAFLEHPDGTLKYDDTHFFVFSLARAKEIEAAQALED